jgi:predicted nucleotidyltransferase
MVEFYEPIGLKIVDLKDYLESILNVKVDLITKNSIQNPYIKKSIEEDLIYV